MAEVQEVGGLVATVMARAVQQQPWEGGAAIRLCASGGDGRWLEAMGLATVGRWPTIPRAFGQPDVDADHVVRVAAWQLSDAHLIARRGVGVGLLVGLWEEGRGADDADLLLLWRVLQHVRDVVRQDARADLLDVRERHGRRLMISE